MKIPGLDDNHIPVDADRLMNMDSVDEWLAGYQSVKHFANAAHTTITAQHYEIQALKAQIEKFHERLDVEHDVAALQGWLYGRSDAINFEDSADHLSGAKNQQLGELRKIRRAMIRAEKESDNERIS